MKKILIKDIKGIKMTDDIRFTLDAANASQLNTYDMRFGCHSDSIMEISFFLLKNGGFERSLYFDGNPFDFRRISWYLSDLFNSTITDAERMMRTMDLAKHGQIMMSERFGLNHFEILK